MLASRSLIELKKINTNDNILKKGNDYAFDRGRCV